MALTKQEREVLYEIQKQLALSIQRHEAFIDTYERLKVDVKQLKSTVYENGLNTRVKELHDWMKEQKLAAIKLNGETKILGMKINGDTRLAFINGAFILLGMWLSFILGR